jgi:succinoglycan biosynthesis transport protein ExoP
VSGETPAARQDARAPKHLWDYWRIVWEGRRILVASVSVTLAVAVLGTLFFLPRKYRAETLVEIRLSQPTLLGTVAERGTMRSYYDQERDFRTEFVRITTRALVADAIARHDLTTKVPDLAKMKQPEELLRRAIDVERLQQTNVATIAVSWGDPVEAAVLANAIADTYVQSDLEEKTAELRGRLERLRVSLGEKSEARRAVIERELAIIKSDPPLETILGLSTMKQKKTLQDLWKNLQDAETQLADAQAQLGSAHPEVAGKRAVRDRIREQVTQSREAAIRELKDELRGLKGDPDAVVANSMPTTSFEQEANEEFEKNLREREAELQIMAQIAEAKAHVMQEATPPSRAYSPKWGLNVMLALVVGLGFGGGLVLFRDYLDVSIRTLEDVEEDLGLNLLAVVPLHDATLDAVAKEAFQTLRTGLLFASGGRRDKVLLVTSGAPQDGKSTVVADLARTIAAAGESVVVVDCDLRRSQVAKLLGVRRTQGLSNYLAEPAPRSWKEYATEAAPNLTVLPTGPVPPNPVDLLNLDRFRELLKDLRKQFDWVLLDSPPVSSVSDAVVLASLAEMVLVVIRHDQTDKDVVRRGLSRLRGAGAKVIGAVLNAVDMTKSYNREYYYGRFYYGSYYGRDAEQGGSPAVPQGAFGRLRKMLK